MSYMQNNLAFAGGVQELSFDEISYVSGGDIGDDTGFPSPWEDAMLGSQTQSQRDRSTACTIIANVGGGILGFITGTAVSALATPVAGAIAGIAMAGTASVAISNSCTGPVTVVPNPK